MATLKEIRAELHLRDLTKKIQEEIPEIMELKRDCEVEFELTYPRREDNGLQVVHCGKGFMLDNLFLFDGIFKYHVEKTPAEEYARVTKIIGRPINMFDIKQCLDYNKTTNEKWLEISNLWKTPDNLNNQSEELINILYEELIENKNS